ncbi:nucleotidyltransferase domain-containing protein [Derxia gummosa]|uniref:Nucleotidyltransferase domain-containing protein n=1 Tax=Derxia gummosa DSM 723 TaxID=1121388 RepID=A0A8B6X4J3_9BURK|nr:nucleotidyltransferase domain-containing protein [Derxia gummosa]
MIPADKQQEILRRLAAAEAEHDVRVLLAVESGSRAWGFASPDSDYDGRFIHANRPDWYAAVTLEEQRDVIEYPIVDDMDINGWDLRKALRLFWKSNPAFVEWLQSPITYVERGSLRRRCRELLPEVYSIERGVHHYRSMAKTNFREHLLHERVRLKKYFYVLRALLSVRWLLEQRRPAPIEFARLLPLIDAEPGLRAAIDELLDRKRVTPELGLAPPIPAIQRFIVAELDRLERLALPVTERGEVGALLNELFRATLRETWG